MEGKHKMPNGKMMKDSDMKKMMSVKGSKKKITKKKKK
jgi:hypothetical protein